jgi:hypothetical protein
VSGARSDGFSAFSRARRATNIGPTTAIGREGIVSELDDIKRIGASMAFPGHQATGRIVQGPGGGNVHEFAPAPGLTIRQYMATQLMPECLRIAADLDYEGEEARDGLPLLSALFARAAKLSVVGADALLMTLAMPADDDSV